MIVLQWIIGGILFAALFVLYVIVDVRLDRRVQRIDHLICALQQDNERLKRLLERQVDAE